MTPRKTANPDAITQPEAANILGIPMSAVKRLMREGALHRVPGKFPSLSKAQVEDRARSPQPSEWVTATETAQILGLSTTRVWQLALKDLLPFEYATSGRRRYRRSQIEVISRARQTFGTPPGQIRQAGLVEIAGSGPHVNDTQGGRVVSVDGEDETPPLLDPELLDL